MDLSLPEVDTTRFKSALQIGRVISQTWAGRNLYCAACSSETLGATAGNYKATDFICPQCGEAYELKSGTAPAARRIVDAAYSSMVSAIRSDRAPNLLYLHYRLDQGVQNLLLIPRFFFTEHCIERRKPLAPTAKRAGWVGCNIRVDLIAPQGRIDVVRDRVAPSSATVRANYQRLAPLRMIPPSLRGWTLAVLLEIHRLQVAEFSLAEIYGREQALQAQFTGNQHVRPKIRQQLQVLRDLGLVEFCGGGEYRLLS